MPATRSRIGLQTRLPKHSARDYVPGPIAGSVKAAMSAWAEKALDTAAAQDERAVAAPRPSSQSRRFDAWLDGRPVDRVHAIAGNPCTGDVRCAA